LEVQLFAFLALALDKVSGEAHTGAAVPEGYSKLYPFSKM